MLLVEEIDNTWPAQQVGGSPEQSNESEFEFRSSLHQVDSSAKFSANWKNKRAPPVGRPEIQFTWSPGYLGEREMDVCDVENGAMEMIDLISFSSRSSFANTHSK